MARKAPGKHYRKGISLVDAFKTFPNDKVAEQWFASVRWPQGMQCPHCQRTRISTTTHPRMPYRCKDCRKFFSVRTSSVMESSKLGYQIWAIVMYILTTGIKGTACMKLYRDLDVTQKSAWHLAHRIRECWSQTQEVAPGPVEVDETYIGGVDANKHASKKTHHGNTYGVKQPVVGMKSRETNQIKAEVLQTVSVKTSQRFVKTNTEHGGTVYSDQHRGYWGLRKQGYNLEQVNHSVKEYVNDQAHTNGIESFWALLKRGYHGTYHKMSRKHLQRYVNEFACRHNIREQDTIDQMAFIARNLVGKRLRYQDLVS